jgi:acyl-coenzyme A thioesterase 13
MDLESVKRYLEKGGETASTVNEFPLRFMEPLIMGSLRVDLIEPGRVICSMKIPPRLLNSGNSLHGGATAALVDVVGSAAIPASGHPGLTGVSVEINVSYLDAAYVDVCTSLCSPLISFSIMPHFYYHVTKFDFKLYLYCCKIC